MLKYGFLGRCSNTICNDGINTIEYSLCYKCARRDRVSRKSVDDSTGSKRFTPKLSGCSKSGLRRTECTIPSNTRTFAETSYEI